MSTWYEIKAQAQTDQPTEVLIYDEIGGWGITAAQFVRDLKTLGEKPINIRINSPGGSVFDGLAIYHYLANRPNVTVTVDGIAASIASIIAMAGTKRVMPESAYLMIHNPWTGAVGDANDLRDQADLLDKLAETLAGIYSKVTKKGKDVIRSMMDAETWIDGATALSDGFVTDLTNAQPINAKIRADRFTHTPSALVQASAPAELSVEDDVAWNDASGIAYGEIIEVIRSGVLEVPDAAIRVDASAADPAALIKVYQPIPGTDAFVEGEVLVGLNFSQLTKVENLKVVETENKIEEDMKNLLNSLAAAGLISSAELNEEQVASEFSAKLKALTDERDNLKNQVDSMSAVVGEIESLKAQIQSAQDEKDAAAVDAAVADGRISEESKTDWVAKIKTDRSSLDLLAKLPSGRPQVGTTPLNQTASKSSDELRAEFDAITDPKAKTNFWRQHKASLLKK